MKALLLILLALALPASAVEFTGESLETIRKNIDAKRAVLVDTRGQEEWNDGHVEGAIFLPMNRLRRMEPGELEKQLPKDKVIYTHCVVGMRARAVGKVLESHGYTVRVIKPGYGDLIAAGFRKAKE
jgi:phage shock protein E